MNFTDRLYNDLDKGYFENGIIQDWNNGRNVYCITLGGIKRFYESTKNDSNADKILQQFIKDENITVTRHYPIGCM